jgi:hypothetical protein
VCLVLCVGVLAFWLPAWAQNQKINGGLTVVGGINYAADAGSTDTYAITLAPAITTYVTGTCFDFKANTANTGAATLNVNTIGAKTIKKAAGGVTTDLATNDIRAGQLVTVCYDGTNLQMQSTLGNAASGTVTLTGVETLTNKRITPRYTTLTTSTTYTCTGDDSDVCEMAMSGGAGTLTFAAPTGTPTNGQLLLLAYRCTVAAQTIAMNAIFIASPNVALPTTCPLDATKLSMILAQYSVTLTKWQVIATN